MVKVAPLPANEPGRLATLRECRILDTPAEPTYDDLAHLATLVCDTPIGTVTLVDEHRQWFKARIELEPTETPRSMAFCAFTILSDDVFVVPDTTQDERFATNGLVTAGPKLRFYAGAPLVMGNGHRVGTVAVMDVRPRELRPAQIDGLRTIARQVVAQLELRRQLAESDRIESERFRLVARVASDAIWDWDLATNAVWWSEGLTTLFGLSGDDLATSDDWLARVHPDDADGITRSLEAALVGVARVWAGEYRFRRRDGEYADVSDRAQIMRIDGKAVRMIGAMLDQTERRRLELELRQSQKMEALGQLSGGVAHDFNNILTAIQGNAALIAGSTTHDECTQHAAEIMKASDRGAGLTRQLLLLSRKQVMQMRVVQINDVVGEMMRMLRRTLESKIDLVAHYGTDIPPVKADVGMLDQVLLNLAVNARDAMPEGGKLTIETGVVGTDVARPHDAPPGPHVFVRMIDTGKGMPPHVQAHAFEPFFTTKEVGKGTGLGLATVYGIVKQHRGWLDVTSEVGRGSVFCFYIPATNEQPVEEPSSTQPRVPAPSRGAETILVVEDEEPVRKAIVALLQSSGYDAIAARSGAEAWAMWPEIRERVDLVFTDLVMPDLIGGKELADRLRNDKPGIAVIYTSGYAPHETDAAEELKEGINFLSKPHRRGELERIIRAALDRAPTPSPKR